MLAILVQGRRSDDAQLATRQWRLEHVARVHCALGSAGTDDRVHLVDEDHEPPLGIRDLLDHRLHALLELATVFGAREHRGYVELQKLLVRKRARDVAGHHPLCEALHDRGLAHARLADQYRVVLRAPGQDLDHPPDLLVPSDHRIQLAEPRERGQVAAVALQSAVLLLGTLIGDAMAAPDRLERLAYRFRRGTRVAEHLSGIVLLTSKAE